MNQSNDDPKEQGSVVDSWIKSQASVEPEIYLSVVVPAYNEEWRLAPTLIDIIDYLDPKEWKYEIIVVDDGSSDNTVEVVKKFQKIRSQVNLIRLPNNYGKGHAVRTGCLNAKGQYVLFTDADGSTPIKEVEKLLAAVGDSCQVAIGSRALNSSDSAVKSRWYRRLPGRIFNFFVNLFLLPDFKDTQCGFKLFHNQEANFLFSRQTANGFSFDLELLFLCKLAAIPVKEVAVNWTHVPGSKVNLAKDSILMLIDLFVFKVRHRALSAKNYQQFKESAEHKA